MKTTTTTKTLAALAALGIGALMATAQPAPAVPQPAADPSETLARGEYLVTIMDCVTCHTPFAMTPQGPAPDMSRAFSGHPHDVVVTAAPALGDGPWMWAGAATNAAYAGPWGVSFAANLTPDRETGLGAWTEEDFIAALRTGLHLGRARPILPPMPYPAYGKATDEDLRAIFAYLRSLPPIHNQVPAPLAPPSGG